MTEAEWLACAQLGPMLEFVQGRASERKLRLFAAACCRCAWHLMTDPRHRNAVEAAERRADGLLSEAKFTEAMGPVVDLWGNSPNSQERTWEPFNYMTGAARHLETGSSASYAASFAAGGLACLAGVEEGSDWLAAWQAEEAVQCALLRDLLGSPYRPFQFDPPWRSGEGRPAVELARVIYGEGRYEALPTLADVLERAGCHDRAVLDHCRQPSTHVRGCWVLDALLGRESAVLQGMATEADWQRCDDLGTLLHFLRDKGSDRKWRLFAVACCRRIDHLITDERSRRAVDVAARYADGAATEEEREAVCVAAQEAQEEANAAEYHAEAEANFCMTPEYAAVSCRSQVAHAARSAVYREPRVTDAEPVSSEADYWGASSRAAAWAAATSRFASLGGSPSDEERDAAREAARAAELRAHCEFLRDLFGEYFGPPGDEGAWLPGGPGEGELDGRGAEWWCVLPRLRKPVIRDEWLAWNGGTVRKMAQHIYDSRDFSLLPILCDALEEAGCGNEDVIQHCRLPGEHVRGCWVIDLLLGKS